MIDHQTYKRIKELQSLGLSVQKVANNVGLTYNQVDLWWHRNEEDYLERQKKEFYLDNYKSFILDILRVYPQIKETNIYYKLKENFADFECRLPTFYKFMKKLRMEFGFDKFKGRNATLRNITEKGVESQVDFGQYKIKSMYGTNIKVYFFCMIMSYSNFRFVYFEPKPFTTETAIKAHKFAFEYFGGRTKEILYDLDRVFVRNENYGDVIFVKAFEDYVKETGFIAKFCRPRDPQSKGKVENLVQIVKQNFLEGRTYFGIDSLNNDCLKWLDTAGNEKFHEKQIINPRLSFREEQKFLTPVKKLAFSQEVYSIHDRNYVTYKLNKYTLPHGTNVLLDYVKIVEVGNTMQIYNTETNELICEHKLIDGKNQQSITEEIEVKKFKSQKIESIFSNNEFFQVFYKRLKEKMPRYINAQSLAILSVIRFYTADELNDAFKHCITVDICNFTEFMSYLIFKFGKEKAKEILSRHRYYIYTKRAREIEVSYGK